MGVKWTAQQQQVIDSRNRNLLVSAAAGSGKTAVLVERIIRMVTDPAHPLDIDRLLVMTFTNAAAAEMRERIGAAIEQRLLAEPDNEHLQMQATLVHHAQITTIDSFCLDLIRNHFDRLELDPAFRIGDEGELKLLREDVMEKLLEARYEESDPDFEAFVETYAQGKGDGGIGELILKVYQFSQSNPWPQEWLDACLAELEIGGDTQFEQLTWVNFMIQDIKKQLDELIFQLSDAIDSCEQDDLLAAYLPMLQHDRQQLMAVQAADSYEGMQRELQAISWDRMAVIRKKDVNAELKVYVTGCRERVKKAVKKIIELYAMGNVGQVLADLEGTKQPVRMLLLLAGEFSARYQQRKQDGNIVDFNDLEHEALHVLLEDIDGVRMPTSVADELSGQYEEILVDEYQDSNMVQETLIKAISRERFGTPNVFMVGDVKQSIYKFRLAKPELFLEKYDSYRKEDSLYQKIELHQNFRSRSTVLESINEVFYRIMTANLGNIYYTEAVALHPGTVFAEPADDHSGAAGGATELLLLDTGKEALGRLDDEADYTSRELEARLVAARIRELLDPEQGQLVWDKNVGTGGGYRRASYRDIAILLRSTAEWAETFLTVFMSEDIPAYAESKMGYFDTLEVETVLSLLAVIDNPMQDIPLAAVLKSPVCGLKDDELARLAALYKKVPEPKPDRGIYGAWRYALTEAGQDALRHMYQTNAAAGKTLLQKIIKLDKQISRLRQESVYLPIHELIYRLFQSTGYYDYVSAMPGGDTRQANLDMLVEKAAAYEQTSYKGLFHFIRYIEKLKKFNTDFGEAATVGEDDDTVRIMSIHKSKGLEFPIVFLAGMGKQFNKRDIYSRLLIDPELGIGTDYLDLEHRLKAPTLKKNVVKRRMEMDSLGEELRVLYVGMTRAKEKLIMTAADRSLEKKKEKFAQLPLVNGQIPYTILAAAGSCLDWILMSDAELITVREIPVEELVGAEMMRQVKRRTAKTGLLNFAPEPCRDEAYHNMLVQMEDYRYPWQAEIALHTKMSVSELKRQEQLVDEEETWYFPLTADAGDLPTQLEKPEIREKEKREFRPQAERENTGVIRGNAYHQLLQLLDFTAVERPEEVQNAIAVLVAGKRLRPESAARIRPATVWKFLISPLGQRMKNAQTEGRLYKERQFIFGIPAAEMTSVESSELIVIQGIIDAYMEEPDGLVLVDYKTDRVLPGQEELLIKRYGVQLGYYKKALEQITGKPVKEAIIYSISLQQEIKVIKE